MDKRHFCISIAGHYIGINALYTQIYILCEKYISQHAPELYISVKENDIEVERSAAQKLFEKRSNDYLETIVVYRKICEELLPYNIFLMHGAVVALGNVAYMFTADSGTGKTTHIKKWINNAEGAFVVNGDKPLIKMTDTQAIACGTPWCGKEQMGTCTMVPLKAIILMERGEGNEIEEVSYGQAFTFLLKQTYWPKDADKMRKTLALLSELKGKVKFFKYRFNNLKDDAFDVAYEALTGKCE